VTRRLAVVAVAAAAFVATPLAASAGGFALTSPAFKPGGPIPAVYTCKGKSRSPALRWTGAPKGTKGFAIELEDPDAPLPGGFTHWLGWGIPATAHGLAAGAKTPVQGANGTGKPGYIGPCPPSGVHHYHFTLYALNAPLQLAAGADRAAFTAALKRHVIAKAALIGTFAAS
jgi:Raf kinase inhibitor-like YbhB/YbcL family protein